MNPSKVVALMLAPGGVLLAAGAVLLRMHFEPPAVPEYGIASAAREGPIQLEPSAVFDLELRPRSAVAGAIAARCFLLRADEARPWDPPVTVSVDGSVRISGEVAVLFAGVPPGAWEVVVAVGRPETLPALPRAALEAKAAPGRAAWRLLKETVDLRL